VGQLPSLILRKPSARDCPRNCRSALECGSLLPHSRARLGGALLQTRLEKTLDKLCLIW